MNCVSKEPIKYTRPLKHQNVFRLQHKEEMLAQIHLISTFILLRLAACVQVDLDPPFPGADQPCYQEVPHQVNISQFKTLITSPLTCFTGATRRAGIL